ncbi:hypothetical protein ACFX2J_000516 [Malus domestica]
MVSNTIWKTIGAGTQSVDAGPPPPERIRSTRCPVLGNTIWKKDETFALETAKGFCFPSSLSLSPVAPPLHHHPHRHRLFIHTGYCEVSSLTHWSRLLVLMEENGRLTKSCIRHRRGPEKHGVRQPGLTGGSRRRHFSNQVWRAHRAHPFSLLSCYEPQSMDELRKKMLSNCFNWRGTVMHRGYP